MARRFYSGFALQSTVAEGYSQVGSGFTYNTATIRNPGSTSQRVTPSAAGQTYVDFQVPTAVNDASVYGRVYAYFPSLPPARVDVLEVGSNAGAQWGGVALNTNGTVSLETSTGGTHATSTTALSTSTWYRLEIGVTVTSAATNDTLEVRVYLGDSTIPLFILGPISTAWMTLGVKYCDAGSLVLTGTMTWDVYLTDWAVNDSTGTDQNSWCGPGRVFTLRPVADGTAGTAEANWTKPGGATTSKWTSVDNTPPTYAADSTAAGSAENFLRNATAASSDVTLAVTDYATAGISASDTIAVVQPIATLGSSSTTAKSGTLGMPANPVISQTTVAYPTVVASATATTWAERAGSFSYAPAVTRSTQPQIRLNRPATSAGTAMVDALAVIVDATPAPVPPGITMAPYQGAF